MFYVDNLTHSPFHALGTFDKKVQEDGHDIDSPQCAVGVNKLVANRKATWVSSTAALVQMHISTLKRS